MPLTGSKTPTWKLEKCGRILTTGPPENGGPGGEGGLATVAVKTTLLGDAAPPEYGCGEETGVAAVNHVPPPLSKWAEGRLKCATLRKAPSSPVTIFPEAALQNRPFASVKLGAAGSPKTKTFS